MKKRENKKAQVSVFIIFAIIIVVVAGLAYVISKNAGQGVIDKNQIDKEQLDSVSASVLECFNDIYKESLNDIGLQGGYINEPLSEYFDSGFQVIPFYYFGGMRYIPSQEFLSEELSSAVSLKMNRCFLQIDNYGLDYNFKFVSNDITFGDDYVEFVSDIDVSLIKGDKVSIIKLKEHPVKISSRLKEMNSFASYIAYSNEINSGGICMNCLLEIAGSKKLDVEILNDINGVLLVNIINNKTGDNPRIYRFLMTDITSNAQPKINLSQFKLDKNQEKINYVQPPKI